MGELITVKVVDKVVDKSLDKIIDIISAGKDRTKFDKEKADLKNELDEMISQVDDIKYGGTFYKYIDTHNIIDRILGNWLDPNGAYISKENVGVECIEYIKKAGITLDAPDESNIKDYIEKLFIKVENFCVNNIDREDAIIINRLREIINSQLASQTQTILENNNENTKEIISNNNENTNKLIELYSKLKPKDSATLTELSEITKIKFQKRFLNKGLFEEKFDEICPKSMTLEKMYVQPTVKIYIDSKLKNGSEDINIDALINAFVEHKNKDDFLNKLNIASHDNKIIDNLFKCFEDREGIFEDEKEKDPYKKILFIYGDAGTGKSTFIYKKCHTNNDENMYVLSMKDISIATDNETLKYKYDGNDEPKVIEFDDIQPNSVLYLDGFDESSNATHIVQKIYNKTRKYNLKIIVTSRIDYKISGNFEKHIMYSKMNFLSNDEILKYVDIYFSHYGIKNTTNYNNYISHIEKAMEVEKNAELNSETTTDKNDKEFNMYKIPIILYLFSNDIAYESLKDSTQLYDFETSSRYGVYKRLFGKQSQIYANRSNRNNVEDIRTTLKNIAFEMFRQCKLNITIDKDLLYKQNVAEEIFKNDFGMLFYIKETDRVGAGEFYMEVGGTPTEVSFEFYHKSFYDYFVAEKMADVIVELMKKYNTKEMSEKEKQEIERLLNVYFGLNYITEDIYYFLDEIIKDNYGEIDNDLNVIRNKFFEDQINIENEFIKFFREFIGYMCIPVNFDDIYIKYGVTRDVMDTVMSNTFSNVTTVLLRVLRQAKIYTDKIELERDYKGINIFGIHKDSSINQLSRIRNLMFLKYDYSKLKFFDDISFGEAKIMLDGIDLIDCNLSYCNLSNAYLNQAIIFNINLNYANLQKTDLIRATLESANLKGANLKGANLEYANLRGANLEGADLKGANLIGMNLIAANLEGVNLIDAGLIGADLKGANLRGADLRNANLGGAYFRKEQLKGVKILDTDIKKYKFTKEELLECGVKIYDIDNNQIY